MLKMSKTKSLSAIVTAAKEVILIGIPMLEVGVVSHNVDMILSFLR